jgi:DmsE family decaheme c-type cytochrome
MRGHSSKVSLLLLSLTLLLIWGCSTLRESHTAWPIKEYEKMIAGRLDADYVGTDTCVEKCHTHDKLTRDFRMSVHGGQVSASTGLPLVNCESCHGPGSLAIENIQNETCDFKTFIPIAELPGGAQSLLCMKCHSSYSLSNVSGWNTSRHAVADVSCSSCHQLHQGPSQKVKKSETADLCFDCHEGTRTEFMLPSHHPVPEEKISCSDCHDVHSPAQDNNLRMGSVRELCTRCHADKKGPFVVEHGTEVSDDCLRCHSPHGSINTSLKRYGEPFLCIQCHSGHNTPRHPGLANREAKAAFFSTCTDCHPRIHGSDFPGFRNEGRFIR